MKARTVLAAAAVIALTGCGSSTTGQIVGTRNTPAAPPSQPAPASTTASISGSCALGWEWVPNTTEAASGVFHLAAFGGAGSADRMPAGDSSGDPAMAYEVTLTNSSSATAAVAGFTVAFYVRAGTLETGSDQEQFSGPTFITPGQSLAFPVIEDHTVNGGGDDPNQQLTQTANVPANVTSCQFLQWYSP